MSEGRIFVSGINSSSRPASAALSCRAFFGLIVSGMTLLAWPAHAQSDYGVSARASAGLSNFKRVEDVNSSAGEGYTAKAKADLAGAVHNGGTGSGSGFASADLVNGTLKAFASASANCGGIQFACGNFGSGTARFFDTFTFFIPGATQNTITALPFSFGSEGLITDPRGGSSLQHALFGGFSGSGLIAPAQGANFDARCQSGVARLGTTGVWGSFAASVLKCDEFALTGQLLVRGATPTVQFNLQLAVLAQDNAIADFSRTARVSLQLPSQTTFTSASGVFLTGSAVPEPATWAMMIGGFGMIGSAMRSARCKPKVEVSLA